MSQPLPLWKHLSTVLQRCVTHERCMVFLDYDGTLAPIVPDPAMACLRPALRQVLTMLTLHPRYQVAIVSGRSLADLQTRVDGQIPYLAGNHGLEIAGPQTLYCHPEARHARPQLEALAQALQSNLHKLGGAWVEDKGLTLTVHFRAVPPACRRAVQHQVLRLTRPALAARQLVLRKGKAVLEVRPRVQWDKGEAVRWLMQQMQQDLPGASPLALYIGDDETDEDAFRAVHAEGLGIVVGYDRLFSMAHYALESVEQTTQFLAVLSGLTWPEHQG